MNQIISTNYWNYEVIHQERKDGLYNIIVKKKSKFGLYLGEAIYTIGTKDKHTLVKADVFKLRYEIV